MKFLIMKFSQFPVTSSLLGPNIVLKTLSLRSSLNVSNQVPHPYKTAGKNNISVYHSIIE
jgi:hypothetical protein